MTMSLSLTDFVPEWFSEMTFWIANISIVACIGFQFRIRKSDCNEYTKIEQFEEVNQKILEDLQQNILTDNKDLIQWREGMLLPPQPVVVINNKSVDSSNQFVDKKEDINRNDSIDIVNVNL